MRFLFYLLLIGFFLSACQSSVISKNFSPADSLVIHFKDEHAGLITRTVQTAEPKAIRRVVEFIDAKEEESHDCGYDGKMFFYKEGEKIQEVDFKMKNDSCNHFAFLLDGKLVNTKMSSEAADFFDALEQGLPFYY